MYKNISTTKNYPKTLVIRNTPDGMIWQIYHIKTERSAQLLANRADQNGFKGITLENHQPEHEETFPNWRNEAGVELRLLEGDDKVNYLLNAGYISVEEVMEYSQKYTDAVDAYDDEQLNKHTIKQEFVLNGDMANEFNDSFPSEEDSWDGDETDKINY
jgi:hypothetical protein